MRLDGAVGLGCGFIVHDGSVRAVACDCLETEVEIARLLRTEVGKNVGHIHLGEFRAFGHALLDFHEGADEGGSVDFH